MKNRFVLYLFFILNFISYSQSQKNDLKLGLSFLPLVGETDGVDSGISGIVLKPSISYFVSNKISVNTNFTYATSNNIKVANTNSNYHSFAFIPSVRFNFINNQKLTLFSEGGFGLGSIAYYADNDIRNDTHRFLSGGISIVQIGTGMNYHFNNKWGIEVSIPYIYTKNITSDNKPQLYSGIGPTLGITYLLN